MKKLFILTPVSLAVLFIMGCASDPGLGDGGYDQSAPRTPSSDGTVSLESTMVARPIPQLPKDAKTYRVRGVSNIMDVNGLLLPDEWRGLKTEESLTLTQTHDFEQAKFASRLWIYRERTHLRIGIRNDYDAKRPLTKGSDWFTCDGVELAFRAFGKKDAPTTIIRGYPCMRYQVLSAGGLKGKELSAIGNDIKIRCKAFRKHGRWTMEWRIPIRSLGLNHITDRVLECNITIHKPQPEEMVCWTPSVAQTWKLDKKAFLILDPPPAPRARYRESDLPISE